MTLTYYIDAGDRGRTGTGITTHGILSPGRLPIPPRRQVKQSFLIIIKTTRIGLEPTTSAVTGRRSNQLNHRASSLFAPLFLAPSKLEARYAPQQLLSKLSLQLNFVKTFFYQKRNSPTLRHVSSQNQVFDLILLKPFSSQKPFSAISRSATAYILTFQSISYF